MGYHRTSNTAPTSTSRGRQKKKRVFAKNNLLIIASVLYAACLIKLHELSINNSAANPNNALNAPSLPLPNRVIIKNVVANHANATKPSHRKPPAEWLRAASNPIPAYTQVLAKEAVQSGSWQCGANTVEPGNASNERTIFAFVHIYNYKAAGTTIRRFFHELADACHKNWLSIATCTDVRPSSLKSRGAWEPCKIEKLASGRDQNESIYNKWNSRTVPSDAIEQFVDIYGGHVRMGTGDYLFSSSPANPGGGVRHVVFLRDPMERYVSGILYQNKVHGREETLERVVRKVKRSIAHKRKSNDYWGKNLSYLLTPAQRVQNDKMDGKKLRKLMNATAAVSLSSNSAFLAETRSKLAIWNLHKYNAIIGFTERMEESLQILKHVFLNGPDEESKNKAEKVFEKFSPVSDSLIGVESNSSAILSDSKGGVRANKSSKGVSTSSVMEELRKDEEHMLLFEEYVKYERMITDFAWDMHKLQYNAAVGTAYRG